MRGQKQGCVLAVLSGLALSTMAMADGNQTEASNPPNASAADVQVQAHNARVAATSAKQAAKVANEVAAHSIDITQHAQSALSHAKDALHGARVDSQGLSDSQRESLRRAEDKLRKATQGVNYGNLKDAKHKDLEEKLERTRRQSEKGTKVKESSQESTSIRSELRNLREQLAAKRETGVKDEVSAEQMSAQLKELETLMRKADKTGWKAGGTTKDEVKAEMGKLRSSIERLEEQSQEERNEANRSELEANLRELEDNQKKEARVQEALEQLRALKKRGEPVPAGAPTEAELESLLKKLHARDEELISRDAELGVKVARDGKKKDYTHDENLRSQIEELHKRLGHDRRSSQQTGHLDYKVAERRAHAPTKDQEDEEIDLGTASRPQPRSTGEGETVMSKGSIDIDTEMPYGELEPFGREDTAQELTENSIHESDTMVDQLERAEVAEEKRSVFRSLTRLRGAAITSFDGVARSQTGNIDEYNKTHKWRKTHPLHHLADEESDISKWAFPDNADF